MRINCETCDPSIGSDEAMQQYLRDLPVHASSFDCEACDRSFGSDEALQQHLRDSRLINRFPKLLWTPFFTLSRLLIMTLLYHQLRHMPTYENTKVGSAARPLQTMLGVGIKMH